jgi:thiamine-phosphate diphosphorylase/hydroxyethylthiazole kinase
LNEISDSSVGTVAIGGINHSNVQRVLYQSRSPAKGLDGVAIVSAIVGAEDPKASAEKFTELIKNTPLFALTPQPSRANEVEALLQDVPAIVRKMTEAHPLVHNMINFVVANFVANVALSMYVFLFSLDISIANRRQWRITYHGTLRRRSQGFVQI